MGKRARVCNVAVPCFPPSWVVTQRQGREPMTHPEWATGLVSLLCGHQWAEQSETLTLWVWSDCAGMLTEMSAASYLEKALMAATPCRVRLRSYLACERDPACKRYILANFAPQHYADDVEHRDFNASTFRCSICAATHSMPSGIDLYVLCFPCTPWSRRGRRLGLEDPEARPFYIGVHTISVLKPCLFLMENSEAISDVTAGHETSELEQLMRYLRENLSVGYHIVTVRNVDPLSFQYPVGRPRLFIVGWREDLGAADKLQQPLNTLMQRGLPLEHTYQTLFPNEMHALYWDRVDTFCVDADLERRVQSGCTCSVDPMILCGAHSCKCGRCGASGLDCGWRKKMLSFIEQQFGVGWLQESQSRKITYIEALEQQGVAGPRSSRERNLLNVLALLPRMHPLSGTRAVFDISQSINRISPKYDGSIPTIATNSSMFVMKTGQHMTLWQLGELMGHKMESLKLQEITEACFRRMLGNSVHVACMGAFLLALLAPLLEVEG